MSALLLDTNICIYAMKGHEAVLAHLLSHTPTEVHVSVITEAELRLGAAKSQAPQKTKALLDHFLAPLQIVDFVSSDAEVYATVRGRLEKRGTPIGPLDTFIAAHALARDMTLVTHNTAEFSRVAGLRLEDWTTTTP